MKKRLRLIIGAFSVSFAFMAAISLFALRQFSSLVEYSDKVDHTNQVITDLYNIELLLKEVDVRASGYALTRDSNNLRELEQANRRILPATERLGRRISEDDVQKRTLTWLRTSLVERRDFLYASLAYLDSNGQEQISPYFNKEREAKEASLRYLSDMRNRELQLLGEKFQTKLYYQQITYSTITYLLSIFAIITVILFLLLIQELKRRLQYQDELHLKISDLKRSHAELEQIAFAVSHDLQEPLRKIQIFSNRVLFMKKDALDDETTKTLERIHSSADRMHGLIDDLMILTSLVKEEQMEEVDLNEVVEIVKADLNESIKEKDARLHIAQLPAVRGHNRQLQLLFRSLFDNALKFSDENRQPDFSVAFEQVSGKELRNIASESQNYYRITISDNGIGFENKFIEKMFMIFQRLHNQESEYEGKGIGLAICQRVMANHGGHILADGKPGVGATFKLYFPVSDIK